VYNTRAGDQNSTTAREAKIVTPRPLEQLETRAEVIGYFEEYMMQRYDELSEMRLRRPLIKSQLLEVNGDSNPSASIQNIFSRSAVRVKRIDETMFLVADTDKEIGVAEVLNDRIVAVYSALERSEFYRWSRRIAEGNPELDHVWFSGLTFSVLWDLVTQIHPPHRFTQIAFTHESVFDIDDADSGEDEVSLDEEAQDTEVAERRSAKFRLTDRIGVLKGKLAQMQEIYAPLHAISQLRFPAPDRAGTTFTRTDGSPTVATPSQDTAATWCSYPKSTLICCASPKIMLGTLWKTLLNLRVSMGVSLGRPLLCIFVNPLSKLCSTSGSNPPSNDGKTGFAYGDDRSAWDRRKRMCMAWIVIYGSRFFWSLRRAA
jgi:hypothetical protein